MDTTGSVSLFPFFTQSRQDSNGMQSQLVNTGVWSTVMRQSKTNLQIVLSLTSESSCVLEIGLRSQCEEWELEAATQMISARDKPAHDRLIILVHPLMSQVILTNIFRSVWSFPKASRSI